MQYFKYKQLRNIIKIARRILLIYGVVVCKSKTVPSGDLFLRIWVLYKYILKCQVFISTKEVIAYIEHQ